ncbi:hypothetical protein TIFTF001_036686 [Ficus carica]|uniref:Putative plant transposon protein domain-containing protein n=1 Tax=Ficus carica TaxID=3494 RepID=A0AA88JB27_FICCA|nr:hypothetical protein TIFTF001_036683 [Ficus carica]GMN67625.1 hypothetical protein TIFTF001_036686 [Ficus carica]
MAPKRQRAKSSPKFISTQALETFNRLPGAALISVVQEFYANAKEHRGMKAYNFLKAGPDNEEVIHYLTSTETQWQVSGTDVIKFPASGLRFEVKALHYFISAKLLPSSNLNEGTKVRALLNYAIQKGLSIAVGRIIEWSILSTLQGSTTRSLGHPSPIYDLSPSGGSNVQH